MNVLSKCNYSFKEIFHASIYKEPIYMWSSYDLVINISNLHCNVVRRTATLWLEVQTALKYAIYSLFALWVTNYIFLFLWSWITLPTSLWKGWNFRPQYYAIVLLSFYWQWKELSDNIHHFYWIYILYASPVWSVGVQSFLESLHESTYYI